MALQKSSFLNSAEFVGFHGQTIHHDIKNKLSIQLGSPKLLANKINKSVISKFRDKDIRNGGVGAPLAQFIINFDRDQLKQPAAIINIGGISNITYVNKNKLIGFDTGPGNNLMDQFMQLKTNFYYDENGELASKD